MSELHPEEASIAEPDGGDPLEEMRASVQAYLRHQEDRLRQLEVRSEQQRRAAVEAVIAETHATLDRNLEPGAWTRIRSGLDGFSERVRDRRDERRSAKGSSSEQERRLSLWRQNRARRNSTAASVHESPLDDALGDRRPHIPGDVQDGLNTRQGEDSTNS